LSGAVNPAVSGFQAALMRLKHVDLVDSCPDHGSTAPRRLFFSCDYGEGGLRNWRDYESGRAEFLGIAGGQAGAASGIAGGGARQLRALDGARPQRAAAPPEWDDLPASAEQSEAGRQRLRVILAGSNEADARLRDFHPFAGILTREERRQARELCGYRH